MQFYVESINIYWIRIGMIFAALCDVKHPKVQMIQKVASVDVCVGGQGCDQCRQGGSCDGSLFSCSSSTLATGPCSDTKVSLCLAWSRYLDIYSYKHQYCQASTESGIDKQQNAHFDLNSTDLILYIDFYLCGKTNLQECT